MLRKKALLEMIRELQVKFIDLMISLEHSNTSIDPIILRNLKNNWKRIKRE